MVLRPIKRAVVPSPLEESAKFDEFVTQYLHKCDDLLSYTRRYPVVKDTGMVKVQRQNRNPNESHRWLRRTVAVPAGISYDEIRAVLFVNHADHLGRWMPQMVGCKKVESVVPNLCETYWLAFRSQGMKAKRDYCQMLVKREFVGEEAKIKPRLFTPSASIANLAQAFHSQSSLNCARPYGGSLPDSPVSPVPQLTDGYFGADRVYVAQSFVDSHDTVGYRDPSPYGHTRSGSNLAAQYHVGHYAGLGAEDIFHSSSNDSGPSPASVPVRRFQIVSVPMAHKECPMNRGFVRAVYESYEEIREYSNGRVEWLCIYHSDFSGWIPSFMADRSVANAFPKEAYALLEYVKDRQLRTFA